MKIFFPLVLVFMSSVVHADVFDGIKNLIQSKKESSAKNDLKGKCENMAKESGPHEIIRKLDKDKYLVAVTVCRSRNNCVLEDALVLETTSWSFSGKGILTKDLWVESTERKLSVKDKDGFDSAYAVYRESDECAVIGYINKYDKYAIAFAAKDGDLKLLKALESKGQDINIQDSNGMSVLDIAIEKKQLKVVEYLQSKGAKVGSAHKAEEFVAALSKNNLKLAKELMRNGLDPNAKHESAPMLYAVSRWGDLEMARFLVEKGAKIDATDDMKITPLIVASHNGKKDIVQYLISKGANVNHIGAGKRTPASVAKSQGHKDIVKILKTAGAD